jgi:hypothetical protein
LISFTLVASSGITVFGPNIWVTQAGGAISLTNYRFSSDGSIYFDCSQNSTCILRDGQATYEFTALSNGNHSIPTNSAPTTFSATDQFLKVRIPLTNKSFDEYAANPFGFWWFRIN